MPPPSTFQAVQPEVSDSPEIEAPHLPQSPESQPLPDLPPKQPEPKPAPKPQPKAAKPEPAPKKMSYAQFIKEQGKPKPQKKKTSTVKPIDTRAIADELKVVLSSSTAKNAAPTDQDLAAIQAYNKRLRSRIDAVWKKPTTSSDLGATVQFSLNSKGDIYGVKIVKSSGNELFDTSILEAFKAVGNAGLPPNKQGGTYQVRFS